MISQQAACCSPREVARTHFRSNADALPVNARIGICSNSRHRRGKPVDCKGQNEFQELLMAIDIGSNAARLLLSSYDKNSNIFSDVARITRHTALGEGLSVGSGSLPGNKLSSEAVRLTLEALHEFFLLWEEHGRPRIKLFATSAARRAQNFDDITQPAYTLFREDIEIISGIKEGRLCFLGATSGNVTSNASANILVVDVGGGSTEIVFGSYYGVKEIVSIELGSKSLSEKCLLQGACDPEEVHACLQTAQKIVRDEAEQITCYSMDGFCIGTGGIITTISAISQGCAYSRRIIHNSIIKKADVLNVLKKCAPLSIIARRELPGMWTGHVDSIIGGCCLVLTIMEELSVENIIVSENDILDGVVRELAHN